MGSTFFSAQCRKVADEIQRLSGEMLFSGYSDGVYYMADENTTSGQGALDSLRARRDELLREREGKPVVHLRPARAGSGSDAERWERQAGRARAEGFAVAPMPADEDDHPVSVTVGPNPFRACRVCGPVSSA